jgi:hypothetical protein
VEGCHLLTRRTAFLVLLASYIGINIGLSLYSLSQGLPFHPDWMLWESLPAALEAGDPYQASAPVPYVWSPVMAWVMAFIVIHIGFWPWAALHMLVVPLLRSRAAMALTLVTWGFWLDLGGGNTFVFAFVAAFLALRGSYPATLAFLALTILMPRPVQLPVALWLVASVPAARLPFVGMFAVHVVVVAATGLGPAWIEAMLSVGPGQHPYEIGPGRFLGVAWLVVGLPIAVWLWLRGRVGWAGIVASPYLLPQYLLMPILDLDPRRLRGSRPQGR